ncbi:MAG: cystathionine gamma-synthase [Endozoicomonadaceae bacterium]|nr:cystathionine gamma-synthase [Endozoicomonadaceae bacterium]
MSDYSSFRFATRAIHAGQTPDPVTGAIMTPVYQSSTYAQSSPGVIKGNYDYSRSANPTRTALEANLASLEKAQHGICFASGCAALSAVIHLLNQGDHVIFNDDVYGGSFRLFDQIFQRYGISYTQVDMTDLTALKQAFTPATRLVWLETPTNPTLKIADITAIAEIARQHQTMLAVDNTFATPWLQNPLELGADIVCHSTTKYMGGHSDIIGGALMVNDSSLSERLHYIQNAVGAIPAPMDCFLLLRSTKTLHIRMQRHCENAMIIAQFLENHSAVEQVIYPGLTSHPQHATALKQMRGFGGMIACYLKGNIKISRQFLENIRLFSLAESLGGVESLIEHPAIMTHASIPDLQRKKLGISDNFIRLSVGIEDVEDLREDLDQTLNRLLIPPSS